MDKDIMEMRLQQWIPILEAQAASGMNKANWCRQNGVKRDAFFKWQRVYRRFLADQMELPSVPLSGHELSNCQAPLFVDIPGGNCTDSSTLDEVIRPNSTIYISCGHYSLSLSGAIQESVLTMILRAMKNAD